MEPVFGSMICRPRRGGVKDTQLIDALEIMAENRALLLSEQIDVSVSAMMADLRVLASESSKPIKIEIINYGGAVSWALALYHVMSALNGSGVPVYTVGHVCYSGAALVLAAGARGHRYLYPESTVMLHAAAFMIEGKVAQADMKILRENDKILLDLICRLCKKKETVSRDLYKRMVEDGEEIWFNAKKAVEFGLADEIITPEIDRQLFGNLDIPTS